MTRIVGYVAGLTLVYALTLGSFAPWDLAIGAVLAGGVLIVLRPVLVRGKSLSAAVVARRAVAFFPFALAVLWDVIKGTWGVALVVLGIVPLEHPGIIAIPIGKRSRLGVTVTALVTTLSPGSFLIDVDWKEGIMLYHVLDASDPDAVRADYQAMYDRYQRHVFP